MVFPGGACGSWLGLDKAISEGPPRLNYWGLPKKGERPEERHMQHTLPAACCVTSGAALGAASRTAINRCGPSTLDTENLEQQETFPGSLPSVWDAFHYQQQKTD